MYIGAMGWVRPLVLGPLLLAMFASTATARAHRAVPPGNPTILQYVETIPSAGGASPTTSVSDRSGGGRSASGAGGGGPVATPTARSLAVAGADGRAALALSQATAPARIRRLGPAAVPAGAVPSRREVPGLPTPQTPVLAPGAGRTPSVASAVLSALTGSGSRGLGLALPVMLGAGLLLGAGIALLRRRSR
jgi:hypothetical protein